MINWDLQNPRILNTDWTGSNIKPKSPESGFNP